MTAALVGVWTLTLLLWQRAKWSSSSKNCMVIQCGNIAIVITSQPQSPSSHLQCKQCSREAVDISVLHRPSVATSRLHWKVWYGALQSTAGRALVLGRTALSWLPCTLHYGSKLKDCNLLRPTSAGCGNLVFLSVRHRGQEDLLSSNGVKKEWLLAAGELCRSLARRKASPSHSRPGEEFFRVTPCERL